MHFYSMSHAELLSIPVYTFWELSKNVGRIQASVDIRQVTLLSEIIGGDPNKYVKSLQEARGDAVSTNRVEDSSDFDQFGFAALKLKMGQGA